MYAVLTAAGSGTRLGSSLPKALVEFHGEPLLFWALQGLLLSGETEAVCVTAPTAYVDEFREVLSSIDVPTVLVEGGPSRQASVYQGLLGLERLVAAPIANDAVIVVHDAARCFAPPELVSRLVRVVESGVGAVVPGLPVVDTIKQVTQGEADLAPVVATPPRESLRSIQTPQAFQWGILRSAHEAARDRALSEATAASDDAALVESLGERVWVCAGDPRAAKITTADDLRSAEVWRHGDEQ